VGKRERKKRLTHTRSRKSNFTETEKKSKKKIELKKENQEKRKSEEKKKLLPCPTFLNDSIFFRFVYQSRTKYNKVPLSVSDPTGTILRTVDRPRSYLPFPIFGTTTQHMPCECSGNENRPEQYSTRYSGKQDHHEIQHCDYEELNRTDWWV
jgi:hypothetical protein